MHDMTTAASKSQFGGPSTSKNFVMHATHGITQWHSIQTGCRRSQHSAKVPTRSSRLSRLATAFQSDCLGRLVSCDPPEGITSMTLAFESTTILQKKGSSETRPPLPFTPTIPEYSNSLYRRYLSVSSVRRRRPNELLQGELQSSIKRNIMKLCV